MHVAEATLRGLFITFEGIDGAGKSSHIDTMAEHLRASGRNVMVTREPGGTPLAERLRGELLNTPMDALTEVLLVFAARRDHLTLAIEPALAAGTTVLCDRFTDSTFAYQGAGRGFDAGVLQQLEAWVQSGLQPDLTLWFDISPEQAAQRLSTARTPDRFEQLDAAFFHRVRRGYELRAESHAGRFVRIDAGLDREAVAAQVAAVLRDRGW
ncbi:MAG: dTMP kinase [Burkholderiales bacterium 28-67-8]|nr:MAG: dTMP kinase [Burkholderiales bacterium 28-67-8]